MLEHFFVLARVIARLRLGPLGTYLDGLATILHQQGDAPNSIQSYLRAGDTFGRWLQGHRYPISETEEAGLTKGSVPSGRRQICVPQPLLYLRDIGIMR